MSQEVRDGIRSCTRGQGPGKQSAEVDLSPAKYSGQWPVAGQDALLAMGYWMLREVEGGTDRHGPGRQRLRTGVLDAPLLED